MTGLIVAAVVLYAAVSSGCAFFFFYWVNRTRLRRLKAEKTALAFFGLWLIVLTVVCVHQALAVCRENGLGLFP